MVATSVRDRRYDAIIANTTASARGEGSEDVLRRSRKQSNRYEDDADAHRRDERRNGDLLSAIQNGGAERGVLRCKIPVCVLNLHSRIVHQHSNRKR